MKNITCKRDGFTVIELITVLAILAILIALLSPLFIMSGPPFQGTVIQKWTDLNGDGHTIYRVQLDTGDGEGHVYNSRWVHDKIFIGKTYTFSHGGFGLTLKEN